MQTLRVDACNFTGPMPRTWLDRGLPLGAGLGRLVLRQNALTGTLPPGWGLRPNASVDTLYSLCARLPLLYLRRVCCAMRAKLLHNVSAQGGKLPTTVISKP